MRHPCPIPCSIYYYPEYNILFATIVSCYFAHKIKPEILDFREKIKELHKEIIELKKKIGETGINEEIIIELEEKTKELIYFDYGSFRLNYMRVINRAFNNFKEKNNFTNEEYNNLIKFAVTHHHLKDMPFPQVNTQNAKQTLELLGKHGVISVLHGHLHEVLEEYRLPSKRKSKSSFFSCGTLSAYCANTVNMFNMIEIQNYKEIRNMAIKILCYKVNTQGYFTKTKVYRL